MNGPSSSMGPNGKVSFKQGLSSEREREVSLFGVVRPRYYTGLNLLTSAAAAPSFSILPDISVHCESQMGV
ncbi:hypothetical protein CEXT_252501 [Caerostris extrusa]|uniref:Uncharacterized protein n=1 Tax=Caerostris extrusa TaxID=172846 RepID=A0AAV4MXW7_CAEEX|nr:hypothetical protein CEXT_252501 [Caerostris extrusa]